MVNMIHDPWECTELQEPPKDWIRATENGWGALVVWAAGPGNVTRVRSAPDDRYGSIARLPGDGERSQQFLLTEADLSSIDDDIDAYLADAGIPPRPRGFNWFIRRPSGIDLDDDTFWGAIWDATTKRLPHEGLRPSMMTGPAKEAMARFYQD
ncbi:DUF5956 family protein [Paenarthrobacter histidinolovorans]|uniref:DUF5956 family protein n=1 Tax=Paenarthrobacter histidinolovorans TaxID=43664 RepID=UPI00166C9679|nr:DUF5956 family protein [Paenarthrobacter histidinolovorans]GGJ36404.1 hypothetical protein GCM10010052_36850 [Paenarthrobacter histidinolovorans]